MAIDDARYRKMAGIIALSCSEKQIQMAALFLPPIPFNGKQPFLSDNTIYLPSRAGGIDGGGLVTPGGGGGGEPGGGGGMPASLARTGLE